MPGPVHGAFGTGVAPIWAVAVAAMRPDVRELGLLRLHIAAAMEERAQCVKW
eukprot:SAG25_NODE_12163_length_286_cov_0.828877_1_plen_51_part_01